jgi:hypothetical protein
MADERGAGGQLGGGKYWREVDACWLVCQVSATYFSQPGDSGSPVLDWATQEDHAVLAGMHGGSTGGTGQNDRAFFSPIDRISMDVGNFNRHGF